MTTWTGSGTRQTDTTTGRQIWLTWQVDTSNGSSWQLQIWVNTGGSSIDATNSFTVSGSWSRTGSVSISTPSGGGSQRIYNSTITTGNPATFSASLSGVAVVSGRNYPACSIGSQSLTWTAPTPPPVEPPPVEPPPVEPPPAPVYAPSAPQSFAANTSTLGQISLSWAAPSSNGGATVTSYVLRNGTTVLQNTAATSYTHTGLSPYQDYSYTVTAANSAGEGTAASLTAKTMGGVVRVWNGTNWTTRVASVKVCTDTAGAQVWTLAQARVWDGNEWKYGI